jgi:Tfp pilus assembly protein PilV
MSLNNKGITLIESLIAVMLTGIAIVGLLIMQPLGWQSAGKADSIARATEIMQRELESIECSIMSGTVPANQNISGPAGNENLTINTTVTAIPNTGTWRVRVRVTWQGNATGVSSSMIVSHQSPYGG